MVIGDDGEERVVGMVSVQHGGGPTESDAGSSGKDVATSVVSMALLELGSAVRGPNDNGWRGRLLIMWLPQRCPIGLGAR